MNQPYYTAFAGVESRGGYVTKEMYDKVCEKLDKTEKELAEMKKKYAPFLAIHGAPNGTTILPGIDITK